MMLRYGDARSPQSLKVNRAVPHQQPHPKRGRRILRNHPEVRSLIGTNPWSALGVAAIVIAQCTIAYSLAHTATLIQVSVAYFIGAYMNHALWVLVHECTHDLIFRRPTLNRAMALVANLPMVFPLTVSFSIYHRMHHRYLGDCRNDADLPMFWEEWLFRAGFPGRLAWQVLFPLLQVLRICVVRQRRDLGSWSKWVLPNVMTQMVFCVAWYIQFGYSGLLYLVGSVYFSVGPHPLGARWIQEHYVFREGQETYSYYGSLNVLAFNVGYHNEHHDLNRIPWNRLPVLKRLAPEMYENLYAHKSWTLLWLRFLFDPKLQLTRVVRRAT